MGAGGSLAGQLGVLAALALLAACATTANYEAEVQRWVGSPVDELVLEWGPPDNQFTLADGRSVIEYRYEATSGGGSYTDTETQIDLSTGQLVQTPVSKTRPVRRHWCRTRFVVSADRVVTSYSFQGNACRA